MNEQEIRPETDVKTVQTPPDPGPPEPVHRCECCARFDYEPGSAPVECAECICNEVEDGDEDNWIPCTAEPRCATCEHSRGGAANRAVCRDCMAGDTPPLRRWEPAHPLFTLRAPETLEGTGLVPDPEQDTPAAGDVAEAETAAAGDGSPEVYVIGTETRTVSRKLGEDQLAEVGQRMADALARKADLESELDSVRKSLNAEIKKAEKEAMDAARAWDNGTENRVIDCDILADYRSLEIVTVERESPYGEIARRPMTSRERQYPLPALYPTAELSGEPAPEEAAPEPVPADPAPDTEGCEACAHRAGGEDLCRDCSRAGMGKTDRWIPERICRTCAHAMRSIDLFPCAGCVLNPEDGHRGGEDRWEASAGKQAAPETDADDLESPDAPREMEEESC